MDYRNVGLRVPPSSPSVSHCMDSLSFFLSLSLSLSFSLPPSLEPFRRGTPNAASKVVECVASLASFGIQTGITTCRIFCGMLLPLQSKGKRLYGFQSRGGARPPHAARAQRALSFESTSGFRV